MFIVASASFKILFIFAKGQKLTTEKATQEMEADIYILYIF